MPTPHLILPVAHVLAAIPVLVVNTIDVSSTAAYFIHHHTLRLKDMMAVTAKKKWTLMGSQSRSDI